MPRIFIGLGSNLDDRFGHLSQALQRLSSAQDLTIVQVAPIIETEPVGGPPQGPYLNTALQIESALSPGALLELTQGIELAMGRKPCAERWAPRIIDLDILFYGDSIVREPNLVIPHPHLHERWFVLQPLSVLAPDYAHPVLKRSIRDLLQLLPASQAADQEYLNGAFGAVK